MRKTITTPKRGRVKVESVGRAVIPAHGRLIVRAIWLKRFRFSGSASTQKGSKVIVLHNHMHEGTYREIMKIAGWQ